MAARANAELAALGEDVFRYFGLGCRNVGKVFIPQNFDLDRLFGAFLRGRTSSTTTSTRTITTTTRPCGYWTARRSLRTGSSF
jgi:hypothetical protein